MQSTTDVERLNNAVRDAVATEPKQSLEKLIQWQRSLRDSVDQLVAARIGPALSDYARSMPLDSGEEKRKLCRSVNEILRKTHLTICDSNAGGYGFLKYSSTRESDAGRFYLELIGRNRNQTRRLEFPFTDFKLMGLPRSPQNEIER